MATPKRLVDLCRGDDAERIAEAWLVRRNHEWANDALSMLTALDPESAWRVTLRLLSLAADDEAVADVGGGPLAELLVEHGDRFVDRAEALARSSPRFATALQQVWLVDGESEVGRRLGRLGCQWVDSHLFPPEHAP